MPDQLEVELVIREGNAEVVLGKTRKSLEDFANRAEKLQPEIKFKVAGESFIDLDRLEKRAAETRKQFAAITASRLDAGNVGNLSKELVRASERSRQLSLDIVQIRKELANPNRKSSIAFLTDELRAAEKEADSLNRKLTALPSQSGGLGGKQGGKQGGGRRGRITDLQATVLELTDDFAPEGFNRPFNAAARGMFAVNAISVTTLATFGAIAAVGYGIVKITENIREEAERRLKAENAISAAVNNQILSQKEALQNAQKMREEAQKAREFNRYLADSSVEDLTRRRVKKEQIQNLIPATLPTLENGKVVSKPNENFLKNVEQLKTIDAQIDALRQKNNRAANDSFNQRSENLKKSQEDAIRAQEKFNKSVEDGKKKVEELGKTYNSAFDNLFSKSNSNNPFVQIFSEGEKALKSLREQLKGLPADIQASAIAMQQKINRGALFETRLDNNLSAFDLRERARNFRNPQESPEQARKRIDEIARRSAESGGFFPGGNYGSFLSNQAGGFDKLTDNQRRDIYEARMFGNLSESNQNSLQSAFARDRVRNAGGENLSINERLQKQLDIIYGGASSAEEKAIADRKLISISSGLNSSEISSRLRETIALANENEAARRANYEKESLQVQKDTLKVQSQIAENGKRLLAINEKQGIKGVNGQIEIIDRSNGAAKVTGASANNQDTANYYDFGFAGGTNR